MKLHWWILLQITLSLPAQGEKLVEVQQLDCFTVEQFEQFRNSHPHKYLSVARNGDTCTSGYAFGREDLITAKLAADKKCSDAATAKNLSTACEPVMVGAQEATPSWEILAQNTSGPERYPVWRVQGGKGDVLLLASLHLLKANVLEEHGFIETLVHRADRVIFETSLQNAEENSLESIESSATCSLPPGTTIETFLARETLDKLAPLILRTGLASPDVMHTQPTCLLFEIALRTAWLHGFDYAEGVDRRAFELATNLHKPIDHLETLQQNLVVNEFTAETVDDAQIVEAIGRYNSYHKELETILIQWLKGDVEPSFRYFNADASLLQDPTVYLEKSLYARSENFAKSVVRVSELEGTSLVVIGASHFPGQRGILSLLEKKGMAIQQLTTVEAH